MTELVAWSKHCLGLNVDVLHLLGANNYVCVKKREKEIQYILFCQNVITSVLP